MTTWTAMLAPSETDEEIRGVVRDVLDRGDAGWKTFADAGLLGLAAPQSLGGEGFGLGELGVLLAETGRRALDLPVLTTLVAGLLPIVRRGTPAQQEAWVPAIVDGSLVLGLGLNEPGSALPRQPATTLVGGRLNGVKTGVWRPEGTGRILVSAMSGDRPVIVLVDPAAAGVRVTETPCSRADARAGAPGAGEVTLHLDGVAVDEADILDAADDVRLHALAGATLFGAAVLAGARDLTADYLKTRRQFGRALAEFQAVAAQIADVYVDSRMCDLGARMLAWRLDDGQSADEIADDAAVAAYWFASHAPGALQTCHHLHGGMGVDETYPLGRYTGLVLDLARLVGGETATRAALPVTETVGKNLELSDDERAFKAEVRSYFEQLVSDDERQEMLTDRHGPAYHRVIKQMGTDGWMGVGWPTEYGGKGMGEIKQQIFANEASRNDVHLPSVTLQTVGPTLQAFGTAEQKERFLAPILRGDLHFAIGYSEPDAGTDLASLRCSAKRDANGDWIVNGQKMWTTGGHAADYIWLAVRTDPDAPKHKGISVLIVDTKDPGYSWTPIITMEGSHHVNATYYNDVRVPADMLVGEENAGWRLITTQLNHERVMLGPAGRLEGLRDLVYEWASSRTTPAGAPLLDQPDVREALGRTTAAYRVNELLNWQVSASAASGRVDVADASASKIFASDEVQHLGLLLLEVVGRWGDASEPETARLLDFLDKTAKRNLVLTFGGGVNEVQRELVAMFGLKLPKVPR